MRADRAPAARGDDARAREHEPRRHPAPAAARDGAVPGRLLHVPGDRHPARGRAAQRRAGGGFARALPAGALEGRAPDPLRRPAAPGAARRLDLPGAPRRRAPPGRGAVMSHHDVIVIGAGLAGMTAAVRLAEGGARVLVLAKGAGSTQLSAVTIDVLGYAPERVESPRAALASVAPDHPY